MTSTAKVACTSAETVLDLGRRGAAFASARCIAPHAGSGKPARKMPTWVLPWKLLHPSRTNDNYFRLYPLQPPRVLKTRHFIRSTAERSIFISIRVLLQLHRVFLYLDLARSFWIWPDLVFQSWIVPIWGNWADILGFGQVALNKAHPEGLGIYIYTLNYHVLPTPTATSTPTAATTATATIATAHAFAIAATMATMVIYIFLTQY